MLINTLACTASATQYNQSDYTIAENSNLKGVTTPLYEEVPTTTYITIDTPDGELKVADETYKRLGKEKISQNYADYKKLYKELSKNVSRDNSTKAIASASYNPVTQQSTKTLSEYALTYERTWFSPTNNQHPTYLYGYINPQVNSNPYGESYVSYHEREIYLNNYQDCVEFISDQRSNGQTYIWVAVYDNNFTQPVSPNLFSLSVQVQNPVEYIFQITSGDSSYNCWINDIYTGQVYYSNYVDTDNFSSYITYCAGSTELYYISPILWSYTTQTTITDYYTRVGSSLCRTSDVFSVSNTENQPYVYAHGVIDTYYRDMYSVHIAGPGQS